jgi:beta-galactosidase
VRNSVGAGSAYYYGAVFNQAAASALLDRLGLASPLEDWIELPRPVELCIRENSDSGVRLIFLLNYSDTAQAISLRKPAADALSGEQVQGSIELEPYGVRVLS